MRKLLVVLTLILGGAVAGFGAPEPTKGRYLIATRRPAREARLNLGREVRFQRFESVSAVAAELTEAEVADLRASSEVLFIEPDYERYAIGFVREEGPSTRIRGRDSLSEGAVAAAASTQQKPYGIEMVAAPQVWNIARGAAVKVGIIDSGVNASHPDLADDYKGGRDFVENDDIPNDDNGHGTHVAGTIGALDNDFGVVGVAPNVEIYGLRVLNASGSGSSSNIIRAIDWAVANKLHVLNLSLGSPNKSILEEQAFQRAADAGIITVAASGNDYDTNPVDGLSYPAGYSTVISVGAVDSDQAIAAFSQRGPALKVVAPGVRVHSTAVSVDVTAGNRRFAAGVMTGSPRVNVAGQFVFSGFGKVGEFPEAVAGKIALISRGEITFREKSLNAKAAGAIGVLVHNNVAGEFAGTLIPPDNPTPADFVPTFSISQEDGMTLRSMPASTQISLNAFGAGYAVLSGTSMASPHVAGVVALLLSIAPGTSPALVTQALLDGAADLGATGFDTTFGHGVVNAYNSARRLAPHKFVAAPKRRRGVGH